MILSLIIATYDQPEALAKVLQGVSLQAEQPDEILVADDGSTTSTADLIDSWAKKSRVPVRHVWQPDEGFRKNIILNSAVALASGDYLVFLDGDCVPHRKFIADHRALAQRGYWVQGRRCFIREPFTNAFVPGECPVLQWALRRRITRPFKSIRFPIPLVLRNRGQRGILGCNMAFWRDDVVAVNGFDEAYSGRGIGADSDLGSRIYNLGKKRKFVYGRALVFHLDHPIMPRPNLEQSKARLLEVLRTGRTRCERGLDQHGQSSAAPMLGSR